MAESARRIRGRVEFTDDARGYALIRILTELGFATGLLLASRLHLAQGEQLSRRLGRGVDVDVVILRAYEKDGKPRIDLGPATP
jgi:hypothetical protein